MLLAYKQLRVGTRIQPHPGDRLPAGFNSAGFSLLEVLVAAALMGGVLLVLLQLLSAGLRSREAAHAYGQAIQVAENRLGEFCQQDKLRAGIFPGQQGPFAYKVSITPQYHLPEEVDPKRITCFLLKVEVFWTERGKIKSVTLETMRAGRHRRP